MFGSLCRPVRYHTYSPSIIACLPSNLSGLAYGTARTQTGQGYTASCTTSTAHLPLAPSLRSASGSPSCLPTRCTAHQDLGIRHRAFYSIYLPVQGIRYRACNDSPHTYTVGASWLATAHSLARQPRMATVAITYLHTTTTQPRDEGAAHAAARSRLTVVEQDPAASAVHTLSQLSE